MIRVGTGLGQGFLGESRWCRWGPILRAFDNGRRFARLFLGGFLKPFRRREAPQAMKPRI